MGMKTCQKISLETVEEIEEFMSENNVNVKEDEVVTK